MIPFFSLSRNLVSDAPRTTAGNIANNGRKDTPFRRPVASFRSATASEQKEMTYGGCARARWWILRRFERKDGEEDQAKGRGGLGGRDKKRTTAVRGYRELHNSWPPHNRAAQSCERADGMSFSFVSSRGDYFSFHSSFRAATLLSPSFSLLFFSSSLRLAFYLPLCFSRCFFLTIARISRTLFIRPTTLSLAHAARSRLILERRVIKLLFYAMRARNYERKGDPTGSVSLA